MLCLRRNIYIAIGCLLLTAVVLTAVYSRSEPEPVRVNISTTQEADFDSSAANNPHTADAGIAVVGGVSNDGSRDVLLSTTMRVDSPDVVWHDAENLTHSGFTVSVPVLDGQSIGILTIPDIGLSVRVYEGDDEMELMEKGVARFRHTSAWDGNIGLSAHNVNLDLTPGYFLNIHTLNEGAIIRYETVFGVREYAVDRIFSIDQYDWSALSRTQENRITLVTCITGSPDLRLVVTAVEI